MEAVLAKHTISDSAANAMVGAAVDRARLLGVAQVVAVLDESGRLKALRRMDGAPLVSVEMAQRKAYTALFGLPSQRLYDVVKDDDALRTGLAHAPGMTLIGGGVPIVAGGALVGAIGVGGGTIDQDIVVAEAGLAALG
jgi:uncharacterized protein GlcG (DUF336 family)